MMETFLEDAENSLHQRTHHVQDGSESSEDSEDPMDDPFLYDKFLPDPYWAKANRKEETEKKNLVDPGQFRYNKRIFVTSLPALLLVLALGGETLVLMAAVGTAVIAMMSQLGDSRRCVITFVIIFIPSHAYILASVFPLLWLSLWHFFLVALINLFVVMSAGWVIIQFKAFRMEEPGLATIIEQMLFTLYPFVCTALVCWALGAVISTSVIPTIFSFIWFVLLQLYLIPTLSSFKSQSTADENLDVIQIPMVVLTVIVFVVFGPALHFILNTLSPDAHSILSWLFFVQFVFIVSLTLFLSTLLSIRQIFEYMGLPYSTAIYVRWGSGVMCTLFCYPVLQAYGLDSHFLPLLPAAIAIFAALGVVLAFKKRRVVMAVLALVLVLSLVALFLFWIQRMPHNLQHYFMGIFPLNGFYFLMSVNFLLCLLCLWMASVSAKEMTGALLILQAVVLTVCEVSLHNTNLYSTSLLQLTSISASYTIHRLQVSEKISRGAAILSSAVHMAKSLASAMSLVLNGGDGEITFLEMSALGLMTSAILSVFVYGIPGEKSGFEITKQLLTLLAVLAVNSHHFLLPVSMLMFQGSTSYTNVIGLWCLLGGGLVLLYNQISSSHTGPVMKVALALGVMGVIVLVVHPQLSYSFYSMFQWAEILSLFTLAAVLSVKIEPTLKSLLTLSTILAICPGLRLCIYLWSQLSLLYSVLCVVDSSAVLALIFIGVFITEMTESSYKAMKLSIGMALASSACLLVSDVLQLATSSASPNQPTLLELPAWRAVLVTCLVISVVLKVLQSITGPDSLPLLHESDSGTVTLPVIANIITVITFFVACTQGLSDPTLHDLWCCASTIILGCLHRDTLLLPRLNGDKQATPTIMTSIGILVIGTIVRSRLWKFSSFLVISGGLVEILLVILILPVFYVAWSILWRGQIASEAAVVFMTPYSVLLFMLATSYTAWLLALSCLVVGAWMMMYKLPMVPYSIDPAYHYR